MVQRIRYITVFKFNVVTAMRMAGGDVSTDVVKIHCSFSVARGGHVDAEDRPAATSRRARRDSLTRPIFCRRGRSRGDSTVDNGTHVPSNDQRVTGATAVSSRHDWTHVPSFDCPFIVTALDALRLRRMTPAMTGARVRRPFTFEILYRL